MSLKRNRSSYEQTPNASTFVAYGTALPSLEAGARDDGSYVPVWKQEVTDDRGRKRLHGAFTGGFSAGYFNTVGSKEGWTPTTFKSSRDSRAKALEAHPEDFMDEEDLREAEEARLVETNPDFAGLGDASSAKPTVLIDLFTTSGQDTMGIKLLKKMGWKDGQGIGARVRKKTMAHDHRSSVDEDDNQEGATYLFAPKNTEVVSLVRNHGSQGIGYNSEMSLDNREDERKEATLPRLGPSKGKRSGAAFGTGILNDPDEDDEDPYEIRPKTAYNRTVGTDKPKKGSKDSIARRPPRKHVFVSKKVGVTKTARSTRKCHDGRTPLVGFILSSESLYSQKHYPPPEIPAEWIPKSSAFSTAAENILPLTLDPRSRGSILGETPLPGKSIFDYMAPTSRERLVSMTGNTKLPQALGEAPISSRGSSLEDLVPPLDQDVAMAALTNTFMPYADDLEKRARYRSYLEVQSGLRSGLPDRKYGMHTQDWLRELREFVGAARIFKPLTGAIATRFTSAPAASTSESPSTKKTETPAEEAAKMGMYGPLTREIIEFSPVSLLCKRFNVPPPTTVDAGKANTEEPQSYSAESQMSRGLPLLEGDNTTMSGSAKLEVVDIERNEALESERAAEDVFQAIFGGSDDED